MDASHRLFEFLLLVLAGSQVVETWRHGSLFADQRSIWSARGGLLGELLNCMFCLSHWSLFLACLLYTAYPQLPDSARLLFSFVLYWLSSVRAAQLLNDWTHARNRSPNKR